MVCFSYTVFVMAPIKIVIVNADDWQGLYINGVLKFENHSIDLDVFAKFAGVELEEKWCNDDWLSERGRLPDRLDDVCFPHNDKM